MYGEGSVYVRSAGVTACLYQHVQQLVLAAHCNTETSHVQQLVLVAHCNTETSHVQQLDLVPHCNTETSHVQQLVSAAHCLEGYFVGDCVVTIYSNLFPSGHYLIL